MYLVMSQILYGANKVKLVLFIEKNDGLQTYLHSFINHKN